MTRTERYRSPLIGACVVVALSLAPNPVPAANEACPAPVPNHVPDMPPPPLNLGPIKKMLVDYHAMHYDNDVAAVFDSAKKYIEQNAARVKRPVIVLDIDETSLTNWPNLAADDFGFIVDGSCDVLPAGPCGFNQWILKSSAEPLLPALDLFKTAKRIGVAVIFITGRTHSQRDATLINLDRAGFEGWTELRTRPDRDDLIDVKTFKTAERAKVKAEDYNIIANIGDQISDLEGENSGCTFKVPNPFYFIP